MSYWKCGKCGHSYGGYEKNCKRCSNYNSYGEKEHDMNQKHWLHKDQSDANVVQDSGQFSFVDQESDELIWIKDSCNVTVTTTDTQAAISLQVGLQLAIALVISIAIGDTDRGKAIAQDMFQQFNDEQTNRQKIFIDNSKDVEVVTTDTDLTVNIEAMLQVLLAIIVKLDIL